MIPSRYNQTCRLDEQNTVIYNPLSGAFDLADNSALKAFETMSPRDEAEQEQFLSRGYFFNTLEEEESYIQERYQDFLTESAGNKIQFMFIPGYSCNFHCPYCYQKGVSAGNEALEPSLIDSFISFIKNYRDLNRKEVVVTLFGGEPLIPSAQRKKSLEYLVKQLNDAGIGLSVVTNGYYFEEFLALLKTAKVEEIHFTLDGDEQTHNKRRFQDAGKDTFNLILSNMKLAMEVGFPINLRLITDRTTMPTFPSLAVKLEKLGFLNLPSELFKTSLGRNYELINEYGKPEDLFAQDEMVRSYTELMLHNPILQKLHMPAFFGITNLMETGEMYLPSFDTCPGAKSEYVFDYSGKIYSCTASCGREGFEIGTYYPAVRFDLQQTQKWRERNILTIPKCLDCSVGVVCGGGCAVIAHRLHGSINSPACKPVKEIMDIGIHYYKDKILALAPEC